MLSALLAYLCQLKNEEGQDLAEYALLAGFIAALLVLAISGLAPPIRGLFEAAAAAFGSGG